MLTSAFGRAVGLVVLYLATECLAMPFQFRNGETIGRNLVDNNQTNIQICGSELTSLITHLCNGYIISPAEENVNQNGMTNDHSGVVEKCCRNPCNKEFLLQHCAGKSYAKTKPQPEAPRSRNEIAVIIGKSSPTGQEFTAGEKAAKSGMRINELPKVRLGIGRGRGRSRNRERFNLGRKSGKSRGKWDFPYKSFGHYLLTLDRNINVPNKVRKRKEVPPQEVGTIKPDFLGGEPLVIGSRNRLSRKISSNYLTWGNSIVTSY